ncbi:MAG: hypothetical protein HZB29_08940 [Nitrospinae bacterium]|nr:hypothetical protein [Nitrospinota bacterium]
MVVLKGDGHICKEDLPLKIRDVEPKDDFQLLRDMLLVGEPEELVDEGLISGNQTSAKRPALIGIAAEESASGKILEIGHAPVNGNGHGNGNGLSHGHVAQLAAVQPVSDDANVVMAAGYDSAETNSASPYAPILPEEGINLKEAVDKYETALIVAALERCNWVKNKAAVMLGLNRTTLVEKLKKKGMLYGIPEEAA